MCIESCFQGFSCLKEFHVYIDINNLVYHRYKKDKKPVLNDLIITLNHLINVIGFQKERIHCICDPSLKYHIDRHVEFEALVREGIILEAPKVADEFILSFAINHEFCFIISNDKFRNYIYQLPNKQWLEDRRISFMFLGNRVCLSPNIDFEKIELFSLKEKRSKNEEIKTELNTTLDILNNIEKSKGEFNLY